MLIKKDEQTFLQELNKFSIFLQNEIYTREFYSFNDVLIVPTFLDEVLSRKNLDTSVYIGGVKASIPIISAPMSFYTTKFGKELTKNEVFYSVPRINTTVKERIEIIKEINTKNYTIFSFGIKEVKEVIENLSEISSFANFYLLDIAHGASRHTVNALMELSAAGVRQNIIVGNIASIEGFLYLLVYANELNLENVFFRVGIGSGSACTTRLKTGIGFPQFSILLLLHKIRENLGHELFDNRRFPFLQNYLQSLKISKENIYFISDGGIKEYGDIAKALLYADMVMLGKIFISREMDTYNEVDDIALYYGMASKYVGKTDYVEGDGYIVHSPPSVNTIIRDIKDALTSSMSYVNARNVFDFKRLATHIKISTSVISENNVYIPKN